MKYYFLPIFSLKSSSMTFPLDKSTLSLIIAHARQAFARKLLHIPRIQREDIEHETQAIRKICGQGAHKNIIAVLKLGELRHTSYYFIDMELCDLNLAEYIHRPTPPNLSESIPYFIKDAPPPMKARQIWNIMKQIVSGIKHMHSLDVVHRDLKPANGVLPLMATR
jgi:serine/threonine protein kinase